MRSLVGYSRTGRIQKGPGSDLVEMQGPDGARHTAIEFHPEYRSHNAINAALGAGRHSVQIAYEAGNATGINLDNLTVALP